MKAALDAEINRVHRWLNAARKRHHTARMAGHKTLDGFFDAKQVEIDSLLQQTDDEAARQLYREAKQGLEARRIQSKRGRPGYPDQFPQVMGAALLAAKKELEEGNAVITESECRLPHGFQTRVRDVLEQGGYDIKKSTVSSIMKGKFNFTLAMIFLGR